MTDELYSRLLDCIAVKPGQRCYEIAEALKADQTIVNTRLASMVKREQIRREGHYKKATYFPVRAMRPTWDAPDEYIQAASIWRVGQRCAAEARGQEWRAESCAI